MSTANRGNLMTLSKPMHVYLPSWSHKPTITVSMLKRENITSLAKGIHTHLPSWSHKHNIPDSIAICLILCVWLKRCISISRQ